jgi:hypothetical protein
MIYYNLNIWHILVNQEKGLQNVTGRDYASRYQPTSLHTHHVGISTNSK